MYQKLQMVKDAGYSSVEVGNEYENWTTDEWKKFLAKKEALGLNVDSAVPGRNALADHSKRTALKGGFACTDWREGAGETRIAPSTLANEAIDLAVEIWPNVADQLAEGAADLAWTLALPTLLTLAGLARGGRARRPA